jgi:hypothetical protein
MSHVHARARSAEALGGEMDSGSSPQTAIPHGVLLREDRALAVSRRGLRRNGLMFNERGWSASGRESGKPIVWAMAG